MGWIFGYGSLIWRPGFPVVRRYRAVAHGWERRFWQASPDHRGVPEAPGRVVTLVEATRAMCWGVAFETPAEHWQQTIAVLDEREKNGYDALPIELGLGNGERVEAVTYIAGPSNPSFVGPAPLADMAAQIAGAHGPSGSNRDYLADLAVHLAELGVEDEEVVTLHAAVEAHAR